MALKQRILIVDDNANWANAFREACGAFPHVELEFVANVRDAYWKFVRGVAEWTAVIVDFRLSHRGAKGAAASCYDGIDLAQAFSMIAEWQGVDPWIIGFTGSIDEADFETAESFLRLMKKGKNSIKGLVSKTLSAGRLVTPDELLAILVECRIDELDAITDGIREAIAQQKDDVRAQLGAVGSCDTQELQGLLRPSVRLSDAIPEERQIRVGGNNVRAASILRAVCQQAFPAYTHVVPDQINQEGYGRFSVVYVLAKLTTHDYGKWFVLKIGDTSGEQQLTTEIGNFLRYAPYIEEHAPLWFGKWNVECDGVAYCAVAYELIGFPHAGSVLHFASQFEADLERLRSSTRPFQIIHQKGSPAQVNSSKVFDTMAKWWSMCPHDRVSAQQAFAWWSTARVEALSRVINLFPGQSKAPGQTFPISLFECLRPGGLTAASFAHPIRVADDIMYYWDVIGARVGLAHCDLHCRNVLQRSACDWVIVDFEDVNANALVPVDAAALECDLKFRCLESVDLTPRYCIELKLAEQFGDDDGQAIASQMLTRLDGATDISELAFDRIRTLRNTAWNVVWKENDTDADRTLQMHTALLFRSLDLFRYASKHTAAMHIWFSACVNADIVERLLRPRMTNPGRPLRDALQQERTCLA